MALRPAERIADKLAIVGADTPIGTSLREELERRRVPGARVDLFGNASGDAVLSEYLGEARLIQAPDEAVLAAHGVLFLCEDHPRTLAIAAAPSDDRLVVDLVGVSRANLAAPGGASEAGPTAGVVRVAHPVALLLAEVLGPIARGPGLGAATAVVLRPASDLGDGAAHELRRQVTGLLAFSEVPTEILGGRLAFDCLPQDGEGERSREVSARVERELRVLVGVEALFLQMVWIPRFHGHTLAVRVQVDGGAEAVARALEDAGTAVVRPRPSACSLEDASGRPTLEVAVGADGSDAAWLWAAADGTDRRAAAEAVRIVRSAGRIGDAKGRTS